MKKLRLILLLLSHSSFADICHPQVDRKLPQYVIGYGSLIDEESKKRTDPTAQDSFPVLVKGYKRSWSAHGNLPGFNATFLSIVEDQQSSFNGVIYQLINPDNIQQYDKRETIYCRKELIDGELNTYAATLPPQKQVWIYSSIDKTNQNPTHRYPIVQSSVDIFVRGCIQIEEKFTIPNYASNCITSTDQWSVYWINDRIFPRRPTLYEPYASKIDALLKKMLPEKFKSIKFEQSKYN